MSAKPWVKYEKVNDKYGIFVAEPLNRGYGTTLGNSLRRLLLSSIGGAAITSIRIDGVDHEFSTIEKVKEDVLDIIGNIKNLAVSSISDQPKEIRLVAKGEGAVTAKDIQHDDEVKIIEPNHHIATLSKGGKLDIIFTVEKGVGYQMADTQANKKAAVGTIPVDASFSPVVKVNHKVEPTRVGKSIDYDKLTLEVWTNGSISPEEAVAQSSEILKEQMDLFLKLNEKPEDDKKSAATAGPAINNGLSLTIDDLELSARSSNCLKKANIQNVAELVAMPMEKLLTIKNFGKKSADEINEKLSQFGLALEGSFDDIEE